MANKIVRTIMATLRKVKQLFEDEDERKTLAEKLVLSAKQTAAGCLPFPGPEQCGWLMWHAVGGPAGVQRI